jgi:hypothetical protein
MDELTRAWYKGYWYALTEVLRPLDCDEDIIPPYVRERAMDAWRKASGQISDGSEHAEPSLVPSPK